jgi:hypothetical protein
LEKDEKVESVLIPFLTAEDIKKCVFVVQGKSIMLDCDLV